MAPVYGSPNYDFLDKIDSDEYDTESTDESKDLGLTEVTMWYILVLISLFLIWMLVFFCLRILAMRQKTRSPQQRRTYMGSRPRQSLTQSEPTIYVSPANLPPPPKYEAMAPPSYEEVVGIHYPNYPPPHFLPITQPITNAIAESSNSTHNVISNVPNVSNTNANNNVTRGDNINRVSEDPPATVITVTSEDRRTSVTVATS